MSCKCGKPVKYAGIQNDIVIHIKHLTPNNKTKGIDSWLCEDCYFTIFKECFDCEEVTDWWHKHIKGSGL